MRGLGLECRVVSKEQGYLMADGSKCEVDELVILSIKIQDFAWKVQFAVIENCPVPAILGMGFFIPVRNVYRFWSRDVFVRF
jgi:hypothetical protein